MLALVVLLVASPGDIAVDVPLYVASELNEDTLARALDEVDSIFAPGGIRLRFERSPENPRLNPVVTIAIQPRPTQFVVQGCRRNRHDHRLGHTHLYARRITLWTEQIARAVDGNWDRPDPPDVNEAIYARALGRVLAHELGHLLLRLNGHRDNGLMRPAFSHRSLTKKGNRAFRFSKKDLEAIRRVIERTVGDEKKMGGASGAKALFLPPRANASGENVVPSKRARSSAPRSASERTP